MATATENRIRSHGPTIGADGTTFRVWAPEHQSVDLVLVDSHGHGQRRIALTRDSCGYFGKDVDDITDGALYFYQLDGDAKNYPDPASHFQPQGVFGPSQLVDHRRFEWTDRNWQGVQLRGQVLYELHVGTFTPEGTYKSAIEKLPHLRDLGVTLIELMPIAAFPGEFGWGYDGVYWYAPAQQYGCSNDLRALIDAAHSLGVGVILDAVYNHFGPCGNFAPTFSPYYFSKRHHTEWGDAINFDGSNAGPVRDFVSENAAYWIREFHFDGLRLDATNAIVDDSGDHIVAKLTRAARQAAGDRSIVVFSEDEFNRSQQTWPASEGGWEIDGIWNDDFHHSCRVAATGHAEAYYADYTGSPQELISAIRLGPLYQGQWNERNKKFRGFPSKKTAATHFVHFLQNHDQVANSARGMRTHVLTTPGRHRALTTLLLIGPQTPLLFMGEEFAASSPFYYFADHEPELAKLVTKGRRAFMSQFPRIGSYVGDCELSDPSDETTFLQCKIDWDELERNPDIVRLHRDLIRLRRDDEIFSRQDRFSVEGSVVGREAFLLRWFDDDGNDRLALFNLGKDFTWNPIAEPQLAPPAGRKWTLIFSSEDPCYGGVGTSTFDGKTWPVPGHSAAVFRACDDGI